MTEYDDIWWMDFDVISLRRLSEMVPGTKVV